MLSKHIIKIACFPPSTISSFLWPVKDDLGLKSLDIYSIPYKCGKIYIGQSDHSAETKVKKHHHHIWLYHPDKSAVIEHRVNIGHQSCLMATYPGQKSRCMHRIIREVIEIKLHPIINK
jgi:hypothetical protein